MKAFSFSSILKNFGKQLSSLASQMPWCNLRFNLGSMSVLSRVSGPFSRTSLGTSFGASLGTSRRASHFAAMIFAVLTLSIANIGMAWGDTTYYLQGISGSSGTSTLTSDFYTTASCNQTVSVTYDGISYTKAVKFGGNITAITNNNYPDRMIRYDCKTTRTDFVIVAYANSNSKTLYYGDIKEVAKGNDNTITDYSQKTLNNGSLTTQEYSISSSTPASLFVSVSANSNAFVVQIIAIEKGDPLPTPGSVGYKVNFKKTRVVARSGTATSLDNNLEIHSNENITAGTTTKIKMQKKGTNYIKFTTTAACTAKITINGIGAGFYVADDKNATENASELQDDGNKTYELEVGSGTHYIVPNGSNMYVEHIELAAPSCTAPNHVDISGRWDRFGGETISLTATAYSSAGTGSPIADGDITGWQWEKLIGSTWTALSNGTVDGVTTSGATTKNLQIANCGAGNSGKYRCVVSTGATCSTASATATDGTEGFGVKVYVLECYTGGTTEHHFTRTGDSQAGTLTMNLTANTAYTFKVHADNTYYGNNGTINKDETNWVMCNSDNGGACANNLTVNSGLGGTFTFGIEYSTGGNSSVEGEPEISVTYPRKTIYLEPNSDWLSNSAKFAYYYFHKTGDDTDAEGWTDFLTADDCGRYADIPQWNGVQMIAVRFNSSKASTGNWNDKWNQTSDLTVTSNDLITITGWDNSQTYNSTYSTPTYTISYNAGTGGSGSKPNETKTCGVDFTLPSSAVFTRTGYTQTGWTTSDGGSQTHALGGSYTTNAAQTFYPVWTVNNYDLTWNLGGGTTTSAGTGIASGVSSNTTTSQAYGTALTAPTVTKTGYNFSAWSPSVASTMPAANTTYTATWTANEYSITYKDQDGAEFSGTHAADKPTQHTYGTETELKSPTKEGYTFGGWFTTIDCTGSAVTSLGATAYTADITLYAKWTEDVKPEGDYCIDLGLGEAPTTNNGGIPAGLENLTVTLTSDKSKSEWEEGYLNLGANDDYITFDFTDVSTISRITQVSFDITIPNWTDDNKNIEYKFTTDGSYTTYTGISSANKQIVTVDAPENAKVFVLKRDAGTGTRVSQVCFTFAPVTPDPDNCGISECGNATLTYTINASTSTTNTADNLLSSATASNTTAMEVNDKAVFSNITASENGKAAAATNECFDPAPVMSSKITMYKGSSYNANTYLQFTFTVKSGYTFTPCDVQFIVQPVMSDANFRWVITNGTTEYGSGTANDVLVGAGNGATALLGLSSTSAMPAGTYYIRLYPYDNDGDDNSFRISNDVILKGTIEEVVCTTPDAPTAFTVGSITSNGATFTITDAANTNNYEIYYSTTSTTPTAETEATITTTEKTKAVTGLTAETTYYAWARAICNEENKSSWVALTNNSFTTSAELTPGECVTIFEAKATSTEEFTETTGTITSSGLGEGNELNIDGYQFAVKPNSTSALVIAPEEGEVFKVGDKLTFVVYTAKDKEIGFKIGDNTYTQSVSKSLYYFEQELTDTDITDGATTITFNRNSSDDRWVAVKIERCEDLPSCTTPVLEDLSAQKVCPGSNVEWTANNTEPLQDGETIAYQWNKKGNSTILSSNATLTLNDVTEAEGGTYVVTATVSAEGKASATATKEVTLTVTPATATPTITASATKVYAGNSVTLTATCASSGVGYQWYCNADGTNAQAIGGATNATYTLTAGEAGTYYYKVIATGDGSNSCGTAEKVYELVVSAPSACETYVWYNNGAPSGVTQATCFSFTKTPSGSNNQASSMEIDGTTYTHTVRSSDWNSAFTFTLEDNKTGTFYIYAKSSGSSARTLTLTNGIDTKTVSVLKSFGTYNSDELSSGEWTVSVDANIHIAMMGLHVCSTGSTCTDPNVTATVDNATVCAGAESTVTFTATNYADGASFQWQKYIESSWTKIDGAISATYTINSPVTTDHAGQYRVIATKGCNRTSNELTLTVLTAPAFNEFTTTASVMTTASLVIDDVEATDATSYAWYKSTDNTFDAAADTQIGTNQSLMIASVSEAAGSTFYLFCVATNSCGSVTSSAITVTVTEYVNEECATRGNESEYEFGFTNTSCSSITYESKSAWEANSSKEYLTYTAPEDRYFATAKVTIAHTDNSEAVYGYSTDGGTTWTYVETSSAVPTAYTTITIELPADVNAFRIGRNMDGKGTGSGKFYLAEACFTYENACTETTLTVGSYNNEYNISTNMDFVEPTFTLKSGENTLEGQTLKYTSSNKAIATVDEEGSVIFEGMTGTVTITVAFNGATINETEYCACQATYTITVGCTDRAPEIVAAAGTDLNGCNNSITLEAKMEGGTTSFTEGTFQWYRDGEAIEGATSASYEVVRAGTYTVSRTYACTTMSSNSAVVTNENPEPKVERLTPFQYYHVDKDYSNQMKDRHLFAVTSHGTSDGKRYHLTATRNGETLVLSSSTAFFTKSSSDNAVDTVMIDLNELKGKYIANDEIVITCAPINNCNEVSAITSSITIYVIDQTPTLALICSGAKEDGTGTRVTDEQMVGGDFLTGYNPADLCQQTENTEFDPNTEWGFYTELKKEYIVTPVNGYAQFNKLNYEPFDIILLTDYPKSSRSEAAQKIIDDMAELCDYRPLLSFKTHFQSTKWKDKTTGEYKYTKWVKKGFTTAPVVPAQSALYADIVCYAHPMFSNINNTSYTYHNDADHDQLIYKILDRAGYEKKDKIAKGIQGFELADASNFVTIGLIHNDASAAEVNHIDADFNGDGIVDEKDIHKHVQWTNGENDRKLVAIAERQANVEARMILFSINCGAQSLQTEGGRQVILQCLKYLYNAENLIEPAECHLTFDNKHGDNKWSNHLNWAPRYEVCPTENDEVRIAAPCIVDITDASVLSVQILEGGSLTINQGAALVVAGPITRFDKETDISSATESEDILIGSDDKGNGTLIFSNANGTTKATVKMYSTAKADMENMSAATSTWQYIGTPHSDVQNAADNYYESWLYQYDTGREAWVVIPNGGPLVPFKGYCVTHPENPHTYTMTGTLAATTNQDITIPAGKYVVVANSWTAPIQIDNFEDGDLEGLKEKAIYFFNTGSDPEGEGELNKENGRYATGTYVSVPIHSAPYTGDSYIPSMQGFYVVGGDAEGTLHLNYDKLVRPKEEQNIIGGPMHAPARIADTDNEPQVAKFLFRGTRYDDRLIILERPDFTRGYDSGWDGEQWGGNAAAPMSYVVAETRYDAVSAIPEYEGTVIGFRAGEDNIYTIHFDYDGMEDALYLLDTETKIYTRVLKGNSYTFACPDKAEHNRFILTRKAPQIATGTENINTGENAKAVKFIKDDKIFIFVNGILYDATGKMVVR